MTKISQKVEKKVEQIEEMFSRQRFDFEKKKIKIVKNAKKVQKFASLSSRKKVFNKLRIIDLWRNQLNEKEFLSKFKSAQIIFSLTKVIAFAFLAQKIFSKTLFEEDVIKFHVNSIRFRLVDKND
jgi:hypothetical protein